MKSSIIREWAENLMEGDKRVEWQKSDAVLPSDIARIVRAEDKATDSNLQAICDIINERLAVDHWHMKGNPLDDAAPEMLEALRDLLPLAEALHEVPPHRANRIRVIIAKAEGNLP